MEYRNSSYVIFNGDIYIYGGEKETNFVCIVKRTTNEEEIEILHELGFSNKHIDLYGDVYYNDRYACMVPKEKIEAEFYVDTYTIFDGEKCTVTREEDGKIELFISSNELAYKYKQDIYNGFYWLVNKDDLDIIWEEFRETGDAPFPEGYPRKVVLYERGK